MGAQKNWKNVAPTEHYPWGMRYKENNNNKMVIQLYYYANFLC